MELFDTTVLVTRNVVVGAVNMPSKQPNRCVSWNPNGSYQKLAKCGCCKANGTKLDMTKLKTLGTNLATTFDLLLRETENILCEVCKNSFGFDIIYN